MLGSLFWIKAFGPSLLDLFFILFNCISTAGVKVIGHDTAVIYGENAFLFSQLTESKDDLTRIIWQKKTREERVEKTFFNIWPDGKTEHVNGLGHRVKFIGNTAEKNGSIQLQEMRLLDEGIYTCIYILYPSGTFETNINVTVLVPPVVNIKKEAPVAGKLEVTLASCFASNARPAAEVFWRFGALNISGLRTETSHTVHPNGTVTVVSILLGVPVKHLNERKVQCVVKHNSLTEEFDSTLNIHYPPESVMIVPDSSLTGGKDFLCKVEGNPIPTYIWTSKENKSSPNYEDSKLLVPKLSSDFNGLYICKASNKYGSSSGSLYLHVHTESSTCSACWVLFGVALFITAVLGIVVHIWRKGLWNRIQDRFQDLFPDRIQVPTDSPNPREAQSEELQEIQDEVRR
ncbi:nectin-3-like [Myxocyprinus asiaticus]|uniref:nectin-3-like n=1 Tax=Myxocyprinus asiaticus TaxID=70543 RepID=UPI00222358DE|nr:nectin-3-like [Myxocyprinus asiaticus]XP_051564497.1 nectin-3-like [Myxocyprinus asiaticus]XP_051564498.1 nectin-3-like [Myxocyprinus asiaticus]